MLLKLLCSGRQANPSHLAWLAIFGVSMKLTNFELMSIDELWALHLQIDVVLTRKIAAKRNQLDQRLQLLESGASEAKIGRNRRPYPPVLPKYQNPDNPSETWSGRGKLPRWLSPQLRAGKRLDDFLIVRRSIDGRTEGELDADKAPAAARSSAKKEPPDAVNTMRTE